MRLRTTFLQCDKQDCVFYNDKQCDCFVLKICNLQCVCYQKKEKEENNERVFDRTEE